MKRALRFSGLSNIFLDHAGRSQVEAPAHDERIYECSPSHPMGAFYYLLDGRCQIVTFETRRPEFTVHCVPFDCRGDHIVSAFVRAPRRGAVIEIPSTSEDEKQN